MAFENLSDKLQNVFKKLRGAIGVVDGKMFPTAGAMLSDNITEFLSLILSVMEGTDLSRSVVIERATILSNVG